MCESTIHPSVSHPARSTSVNLTGTRMVLKQMNSGVLCWVRILNRFRHITRECWLADVRNSCCYVILTVSKHLLRWFMVKAPEWWISSEQHSRNWRSWSTHVANANVNLIMSLRLIVSKHNMPELIPILRISATLLMWPDGGSRENSHFILMHDSVLEKIKNKKQQLIIHKKWIYFSHFSHITCCCSDKQRRRNLSSAPDAGGFKNEWMLIILTQAIHFMFENQSYKNTKDP